MQNGAWSRMSNFLKTGSAEKNPEQNADWEAQVKMSILRLTNLFLSNLN